MSEAERLLLWEVLEKTKDVDKQKMVKDLIEHAAALLDRVIETFPTYTLHNRYHARNVVARMADLLGEDIGKVTPLEAALLMLSAYFHDIGMVFTEEERAGLAQEPEWRQFLDRHPRAYLAVQGRNPIPVEIAEWYCRWRHADRVYVHLDRPERPPLRWGVAPLRDGLGELCRSHNWSATEVTNAQKLSSGFLAGQADLRFCAILLRLADILDFDRSRAPEAVYRHLGLERRRTKRERDSDVEWLKHLRSDGFRFPPAADRQPGYTLGFIAAPDHPAVEHDVRGFLQTIENELRDCESILRYCSVRWRNFYLPHQISKKDIISVGFRYGEYRFTLDQERILGLLMGENLYDDPHVFVRELLQNALDASRLRQQLERVRGRRDFSAQPIRVTDWSDDEHRQWVRIDDFGTGMDEAIITSFLLRIGSSYYQSAEYEADALRVASNGLGDFKPISRFGIGLLSCFIVGDRIEISTRRRLPDGSLGTGLRLTIDGLNGFPVLKDSDLGVPAAMPAAPAAAPGERDYRLEPGTSIAVRLDPRKQRRPLVLKEALLRYLCCPPVPVHYKSKPIGGGPAVIDSPWCKPTTLPFPPEELKELVRLFPSDLFSPPEIDVTPIDLSSVTPDSRLTGQIAVFRLLPPRWLPRWKDLPVASHIWTYYPFPGPIALSRQLDIGNDLSLHVRFDIRLDPAALREVIEQGISEGNGGLSRLSSWARSVAEEARAGNFPHIPTLRHASSREPERLPFRLTMPSSAVHQVLSKDVSAYLKTCASLMTIGHNGIRLPQRLIDGRLWMDFASLSLNSADRKSIGIIMLRDGFRPTTSLSRDRLQALPWAAYLAGDIALSRALTAAQGETAAQPHGSLLPLIPLRSYPSVHEVLEWDRDGRNENLAMMPWFGTPRSPRELDLKTLLLQVQKGETHLPIDLVTPRSIAGLWSRSSENETGPLSTGSGATIDTASVFAAAAAYLKLHLRLEKAEPNSVRYYTGLRSGEPGIGRIFLAHAVRETPLSSGERLFLPLTFVSFAHGTGFQERSSGCINREHPFARWLIENAGLLTEEYPQWFNELRAALVPGIAANREVDDMPHSVLRDLMQRLEHLRPTLSIDEDILPQAEEFAVW